MTSKRSADPTAFRKQGEVVLERTFRAETETVWRFLTEPALLRTWLAGGQVEPRLNGRVELDFLLLECPGREGASGTVFGVITAYDPPRRLAYSWDESGQQRPPGECSEVAFELSPAADGGTHLRLIHRRVSSADASGLAAGWHLHLNLLDVRLAGRPDFDFMAAYGRLAPEYEIAFSAVRRS
jgi:uncharacterized protein YndB with AHSA1/START domain